MAEEKGSLNEDRFSLRLPLVAGLNRREGNYEFMQRVQTTAMELMAYASFIQPNVKSLLSYYLLVCTISEHSDDHPE